MDKTKISWLTEITTETSISWASISFSFSLYLKRIKERLECKNRDRVQVINYKSKFHRLTCTHWRHLPDWPIRGPSATPDVISLAAVPRAMQRPCEMGVQSWTLFCSREKNCKWTCKCSCEKTRADPGRVTLSLRTKRVTSLAVPRDAITTDWGDWCTIT